MSQVKAPRSLPTHTQLTDFILSLLPQHPRDFPATYHTPRHPNYNPATTTIHDVVLSITPTPGVFTQLSVLASSRRTVKPVCFLHRPFDLDRNALPRGCMVLASHRRFDELLTVGWNVMLAERLGLNLSTAVCIQGYKQDPERRIGLVARLEESQNLKKLYDLVVEEFGAGTVHPKDMDIDLEKPVDGIAIMNAFGADEVARVVKAATEAGFISEGGHGRLLYLTGEPKETGLVSLQQEYRGMAAICVGHREAEEWGIRCLGACIEREWHDVKIHTVFEEEEVVQKKKRGTEASTENGTRLGESVPNKRQLQSVKQ